MSYHSPAAFARNMLKLAQRYGSTVQAEVVTPGRIRTVIPSGFTHNDYNARCLLNPWAGVGLAGVVKLTAFWPTDHSSYLDIDRAGCKVFGVSSSLNLHPQYYDPASGMAPVTFDTVLAHVGKSSFTLKSLVYLPNVTDPVMEYNALHVAVDAHKNQSFKLPDWWMKKYGQEVPANAKPLAVESIAPPTEKSTASVHESQITVSSSDMDPYFVTYIGFYSRFCVEAYVQWHVNTHGFFSKGDPFRLVKDIQQSFKGSSQMGDVLTIRFWQSESNENVFNFLIHKGSSLIHECAIEFYPSEPVQ